MSIQDIFINPFDTNDEENVCNLFGENLFEYSPMHSDGAMT